MHPCIYASLHLCIYASMHLCIYTSMHLCMYASIYLSIYLSINLSVECIKAVRSAAEDSSIYIYISKKNTYVIYIY